MYQVVVVDDEQIIREGLCKAIPWESLGLTLVGQAANGAEAWEVIRQCRPEIVVTDIRMPYMDGIELIRKMRSNQMDSCVIILSGYSEFEYAQTAVKLGVSDYVMKPIDIPSICRTLRGLKDDLDVRYHHENEVEEMRRRLQEDNQVALHDKILRYVHRRISCAQFVEGLPRDLGVSAFCQCALLQLDRFDHVTGAMPADEIFRLTQELEATMLEQAEEAGMQIMEESNGRYLILFYGSTEGDVAFAARTYIRRLRMSISGHEYTTAVSTVLPSIESCAETYHMAMHTLDRAFLIGTNQDVEPERERQESTGLPDTFDVGRVVRTIATFNKKEIRREFDAIEQDIRLTRHNSFLYTRMMVSFVYGEIMKLLTDIHCPIQEIMDDSTAAYKRILTCQTLNGMMDQLYAFVAEICDFLDDSRNANKNIVERAKLYIDGHFSESELTLDEVAKVVGMSPNYFSALFKQSQGKSFIGYLTDIRIEHAKRLLTSGDHRSYEVSYQCGYENPTYFSTIFKRHVGVSPSEYRVTQNASDIVT
ncbi:response regulator transcription factor [Butyricicoccus sp. Marseille-Q5471]|uniref:response regulator transcription factor n=1 Tax=Butyricicoccus sp. Marseille-Q5471 TaxID=3039493 RepID=UPI0024BD0AAD|nr:response regulator [Butyricicoccus sp. Marseille-Q5471]